jgi:molybdate transport system permease protein
MVRQHSKNMASISRIHNGIINNGILNVFWLIFVLMIVFLLLIIVGLLTYTDTKSMATVLQQPEFHFAVKFTLGTSIIAMLLAAAFALPVAYILSRHKIPGRAFIDTLLDIPIVLPPLVSGIALLIFFGPLFGKQLEQIGISVVFSQLGVIIAQWFIATPFAVRSFIQAFGSIDQRMEKVARTLGFSPTMVFVKVTLPLARDGLLGGVMMAWARALGEFGATAMLAGITRMKTETLSVAVFLNMSIGDMNFAIATSIVMLIIALLVLAGLKILSRREVIA